MTLPCANSLLKLVNSNSGKLNLNSDGKVEAMIDLESAIGNIDPFEVLVYGGSERIEITSWDGKPWGVWDEIAIWFQMRLPWFDQ